MTLDGDEDDFFEGIGDDENTIPGDNDRPEEESQPSNKDAPINLTRIPDSDLPSGENLGGD